MKLSRSLDLLHPAFRLRVLGFLADQRTKDLGVFITCTGRTQEEQNELYAQGRTKPGRVVTWTRKSNHLIPSRAIDIAFHGKELYPSDPVIWSMAYDISEEYGIKSLYRKKGIDRPHLDLGNNKPTKTYINKNIMENIKPKILESLINLNSTYWNLSMDDKETQKMLEKMNAHLRSKREKEG